MNNAITIDNRLIAPDEPPFIVAEIGAAHDGDPAKAYNLVRAAAWAGADAVKFQAYTPDTITLPIRSAQFQIQDGPWAGYYLHDLYKRAHMPREWFPELFSAARGLGLVPFASVFSPEDVDFCETLGCPAYKIASYEIPDAPLIEHAAETGKPLIVSTGMAPWDDISRAYMASGDEVLFLHCVSAYPCPMGEANVTRVGTLAKEFGMAGLSDHTQGSVVPIMATALGAVLIEKHIKLPDDDTSPDAGFAAEPNEFAHMLRHIHQAHEARTSAYSPSESAQEPLRRSLYVVRDVAAGERLTTDSVRSVRPGGGLPPSEIDDVLASVATKDLPAGTPLGRDLIRVVD